MSGAPPLMTVAEARERLLALARPVGTEIAALPAAAGRVLRAPVTADRSQPPFDAAQMDGYALGLSGEAAEAGTPFRLIGETRAGAAFEQGLAPGEAIRIFTGAPLPPAAGGARLSLALQEDATVEGEIVRFSEAATAGRWIRPSGLDFRAGETLLPAPRVLSPEDVALAAAAGRPWLTVSRRPRVTLLALGDELRLPGEATDAAAIFSSNQFGVAALLSQAGATVDLPPIVPDTLEALVGAIENAAGADLIVTLGGASDGDHDLARPAFASLGMTPTFYKIAMRPGKPLMAGRFRDAMVTGLPGNPVSAMVCARVFLLDAIGRMTGAPVSGGAVFPMPLAVDLGPGGARQHYMRARIDGAGPDARVAPYEDQDSSRLGLLSGADCLLIRPAGDGPRQAGEVVECLSLGPPFCSPHHRSSA